MQDITISNLVKKISGFFSDTLEALGSRTKFIQRDSKLTASGFVETLLTSCLSGDFTYEEQCRLLSKKKIVISKQGLQQRFNKKAGDFLSALVGEAMTQFKSDEEHVFKLLKPFSGVKIQDSSGIELPSSLAPFFKGHGGGASDSSLKLQVLYDELNSSIDKLSITDGRRNDQSFTEHLTMIQPKALYLKDLGYFKIASFKKIHEGKAYFLSRYLPQTLLFDENKEPFDLLKALRDTQVWFEKKVYLGKEKQLLVRLVAQRLDEETHKKRLKNIRKSYRRKTPSQLILELAGWSIYVTNISPKLLTKEQLHYIYVLRWQIELLFKLCKGYVQLDKIKGRSPYRVLCELYAKIIVLIIFLQLVAPFRWIDNTELSLPKAYNQFQKSAQEFFKAITSPYKIKKYLVSLISDFSFFARKDKKTPKKVSSHQKLIDLAHSEFCF
jgi:hypothetical protein